MRRRSISRSPVQVELFPFLSVLACTIGTLILTIVIVSSQMLDGQQKEIKITLKTEAGKNQTRTPVYIECRQDGVLIHPQQTLVPATNLAGSNSPFQQLLARVRQSRDREYIIVAIRPNGYDVFQDVRRLLEQQNIDFGYEPFDRDWKLKL